MRKLLAFILCLVMVVSLISCDNPGGATESDTEEKSSDYKDCYYRLSSEEAYEIAVEYWKIRPGEPDGACGTIIYTDAVILAAPSGEDVYYHVLCVHKHYSHDGNGGVSASPHHVSLSKELLIDATTGECIELNTDDYDYIYGYGYTIYPHKAIDIAEEYWGVKQFQEETGEGNSSYLKIDISKFPHCTYKYYRVVLMRKYYANAEGGIFKGDEVEILKEILVDAVTGECIELGVEDNG